MALEPGVQAKPLFVPPLQVPLVQTGQGWIPLIAGSLSPELSLSSEEA